MTSLFSHIINGDIPCHKLLQTDLFIAFLDINPIRPGHTLLVPITEIEVDEFFNLPDAHLEKALPLAKKLSQAIKSVVPCNRIGLMVAGLEIPHAHLHLVPIRTSSDLNFSQAHPESDTVLAHLAKKIRAALSD